MANLFDHFRSIIAHRFGHAGQTPRTGRDVLIVEDDEAVRRVHSRALSRAGMSVCTADDGLAAFDELQQYTVRAILCDINMPYLGGISFFEQLEASNPALAGRVVFVTGMVRDHGTRRFLESTGQPFLEKPVELAELIKVVRGVAERVP